ncbi:DUF5926 family protein [Helcobacillus massiliensis]|uniref:DUF5926 family protein n=1 Tax=Helcobacillus massiliensis TaxID=521392 RepID=UPI0021A64742|nr:DUF5926 family protein [Helcobacillus massiliensis]MCT1556717.1 DUF5926 family protein [Helcobacillus massiliensis]MCT2035541.1 DUF5926 family protein [Helcobacillus massiliensis]MCT2331007.1 DUF5926 family protein [Helcobacillus massiliensis]
MASSSEFVNRPFHSLPVERDLVAMRQLIPSATMTARTTAEHGAQEVEIATILPMNWPSCKREDGTVLLGMQATVPGSDVSRGLGQALLSALEADPGTSFAQVEMTEESPRLQDLLDPEGFGPLEIHDDFEFWIDAGAERTDELDEGLKQANDAIMITRAVDGLDHGFWVDAGPKEHLRWVFDAPEDRVIDAIARLHARRESAITDGTKFVGSFRADGLTIPVWDLPKGFGADGVAEHAEEFSKRFLEALNTDETLTGAERRARGGVLSRQVTLR